MRPDGAKLARGLETTATASQNGTVENYGGIRDSSGTVDMSKGIALMKNSSHSIEQKKSLGIIKELKDT
jgi:hypothetical protein